MTDEDVQYLSYSGRQAYLTCPKQYWFQYIKKVRVQRDPKSSLFGSTIGKVFEWFYERSVWVEGNAVQKSLNFIDTAAEEIFLEKEFNPNSDPEFVEKLKEDLKKFIPPTIDVIRKNQLLSPNSRCEVKLHVNCESEDLKMRLGGYADFIHYINKDQVWILDGKGSKYREKYVDSEQLIWYATQHYIKYHVAPTRLGFLFYRFPDDPLKWVHYDADSMRRSISTTFDVAKKIRLEVWDPKPSTQCHRCDFSPKCDEGSKFITSRRVQSGGRIKDSMFDIEPVGG